MRVRVVVQPSPNPGARPAIYGRVGEVDGRQGAIWATERGGRRYALVRFEACSLRMPIRGPVGSYGPVLELDLEAGEEEVFVPYLEVL